MADYTVVRASEAPDYTGGSASPFIGYGRPLGAEQIAFNLRVLAPGASHVPPDADPAWGHSHRTIEEIYFVVDGEVTIKIGDDVLTLGPRDAVRLPPGSPRAMRNEGGEQAVIAMCSVKVEDPQAEAESHEGFWPAV